MASTSDPMLHISLEYPYVILEVQEGNKKIQVRLFKDAARQLGLVLSSVGAPQLPHFVQELGSVELSNLAN
jgi:hypothetical protein